MSRTDVIAVDGTGTLDESYCRRLEAGGILLFRPSPLELSDQERGFLLAQRQAKAGYHKNVAYRPLRHGLTGAPAGSDTETLRAIMRGFSGQAAALVGRLLPRYAAAWRLDYASFRPEEEEGRPLSLHARNDLLHVDAFPTRPTNGDRILRFFTNLNPDEARVWVTSDSFEVLAQKFARDAALAPALARPLSVCRPLGRLLRAMGLPAGRPPYDAFMHEFHNFLKENAGFQESCPKYRIEFPPHSSWLVFTDMVSHSVLRGRYALEQTFIVSRSSLCLPDRAPASILERIHGRPMTIVS